jgi:(p)ppGpp synthase/HD superfamily hydrolase
MNSAREHYPQTHIQTIGPLLLLLHDLGYDDEQLELVSRVYHFALKLYAVNFQSSARPFICHLVGTAAWVARYGGDFDTILAALVHAAYGTGDFGVRIPGATTKKRTILREQIGERAERMVLQFHEWLNAHGTHWEKLLEAHPGKAWSEEERTVIFIRVCNELDDISDKPFSCTPRRSRIRDYTQGSTQLALAIERPDLAERLQQANELWGDLEFLPEAVAERHPTGFIELPPAFRKKLWPGIRELVYRWRTTGSWRIES